MVDQTPNLGAWNKDRDALERMPLSGRGSDADASNLLRFNRTVMQLIARRERQPYAEYDRAAAFVLTDRAGMDAVPNEARREPLLNTGHHPLTGRIHFVNAAGTGKSLEYVGDDEGLFDKLTNIGAETRPTLVYSPKPGFSTLSWYPNGIVDEENVELQSVTKEHPTVERITEVISSLHKGYLITPDLMSADNNLWVDPTKGWAQEHTEKRVQSAVKSALLGAFQHYTIREEQPGKDGRTDLEVVEDQDRPHNEIVHHAVLELKVLREKGSTGTHYSDKKIAQHIRDGLYQAYSYGDGRNFREHMLCCFDMRPNNLGEDVVFGAIQTDAAKLRVHLRHWFIYRSSKHWRTCSIQLKLNANRD
jgi:hypothetical protein